MDKKTPVRRAIALAAMAVLIWLDQITKTLAADRLANGPLVIIPGVFELCYLENRGAAFGMLQNQRWFFLILTALFFVVIIYVYLKIPSDRKHLPLRILCVFVTAGAVGNFIDRLLLIYVRDFLYFSLIDFPIFNVADIYVTVSAALFFFLILFFYKDEDLEFLSRKHGAE